MYWEAVVDLDHDEVSNQMAERKLIVVIEANGRYCNNDCMFMSIDAKNCRLFDVALNWHPRKKTNGNIRPAACRKSELMK